MKEIRNFIKEASSWLKTPKPLGEMLEENRLLVLSRLVQFLHDGSNMERKYAAFCLGQIGDPIQMDELKTAFNRESVKGVKEAIGAALTVLAVAPSDKGSTEEERRNIIQDVYDGKRPVKLVSW